MNKDSWDEIIYGEGTCKEIARILKEGKNVLIGFTDEEFEHRDIFFSYMTTEKVGYIQRGIKADSLFVGIIPDKFYGFRVDTEKYKSYIEEKLNISYEPMLTKLTDLINGICKEIMEENNE
jgi:hypothetical protein